MHNFSSGVLVGHEVSEVLNHAKREGYALPAVNVVGTSSVNAVLEAAREVSSPVIIQLSNGGGGILCGQGLRQCRPAGSDNGLCRSSAPCRFVGACL